MRIEVNYECDDCHEKAVFKSRKKALNAGWAVAGNYKNCWCPMCAPQHRVGNAKKANTPKLASGGQQLGIEGI